MFAHDRMDALDVFEHSQEDDDTHPDHSERLQQVVFGCIQYKKIERSMQSRGEDNSDDQIAALHAGALIEGHPNGGADDGGGEYMQQGSADEAQVAREDSLHE